jgi:hypothetical protein
MVDGKCCRLVVFVEFVVELEAQQYFVEFSLMEPQCLVAELAKEDLSVLVVVAKDLEAVDCSVLEAIVAKTGRFAVRRG